MSKSRSIIATHSSRLLLAGAAILLCASFSHAKADQESAQSLCQQATQSATYYRGLGEADQNTLARLKPAAEQTAAAARNALARAQASNAAGDWSEYKVLAELARTQADLVSQTETDLAQQAQNWSQWNTYATETCNQAAQEQQQQQQEAANQYASAQPAETAPMPRPAYNPPRPRYIPIPVAVPQADPLPLPEPEPLPELPAMIPFGGFGGGPVIFDRGPRGPRPPFGPFTGNGPGTRNPGTRNPVGCGDVLPRRPGCIPNMNGPMGPQPGRTGQNGPNGKNGSGNKLPKPNGLPTPNGPKTAGLGNLPKPNGPKTNGLGNLPKPNGPKVAGNGQPKPGKFGQFPSPRSTAGKTQFPGARNAGLGPRTAKASFGKRPAMTRQAGNRVMPRNVTRFNGARSVGQHSMARSMPRMTRMASAPRSFGGRMGGGRRR
jgi:hypothetical protein